MLKSTKDLLLNYSEELRKAQYHVSRSLVFEEMGMYDMFEKEIYYSKAHFNEALFYLNEAGKLI